MKRALVIAAGMLTLLSLLTNANAASRKAAHAPSPPSFPTPVFVVPDGANFYDYRPTVSADGTAVIFERHDVTTQGSTTLYKYEFATNTLTPFVTTASTRADWCWQQSGSSLSNGPVAFSNDNGIYMVPEGGTSPVPVLLGKNLSYPTWYPDCSKLAVANYNTHAITVMDTSGNILVKSLQQGFPVWSGFANVNQADPNLVAFAGQNNEQSNYYNQELNYTWVVNSSVPTVYPMDTHAPDGPSFVQRYQARAGSWSPDGQWFAFESNRRCNDVEGQTYALFLQASNGKTPAKQVTFCKLNIQHPKWFPPGSNGGKPTLIAAAAQPGSPNNPFKIVSLDVSGIVGSFRKKH